MDHYVIIHVPEKRIVKRDENVALFSSEEEALFAAELFTSFIGNTEAGDYIVLPLIDADDYLKGLS